jgi:transcriptional regulator with XRE-family HTH domain
MATDEERQIGGRIAAARHEAGLTQRELAERLGVTTRSIQNYESGAVIPYRHLRRIEMLAQKRTGWLLSGEGRDEPITTTVRRLEEALERHHELLRDHLEAMRRQVEMLKELRQAADGRRRRPPADDRQD